MASNNLLADLARARRARQAKSAPSAAAQQGGGAGAGGGAGRGGGGPSAAGRRLRDGAVVPTAADGPPPQAPPAKKRRRGGGGGAPAAATEHDHLLEGVYLSGIADKPLAACAADVVEVDCRHDGAGFVAEGGSGRVFRLTAGEGRLRDRKGGDHQRNVRHLTKSAGRIARARAHGGGGGKGRVWVHCFAGINRGPAGLIAYLLLHTRVPSLAAAHALVKRARPKARCRSNTFAAELQDICKKSAGKPLE